MYKIKRQLIKEFVYKIGDIQPSALWSTIKSLQNDNNPFIISSVCLSLQSVNFILCILSESKIEIDKVNSACSIYINQVKHFLPPDKTSILPEEKYFNIPVTSKNAIKIPIPSEKQLLRNYYIILQNVYIKEMHISEMIPNSYQNYLQELFKLIDLSTFHNINSFQTQTDLVQIIQRISKHPEFFGILPDKITIAQLLSLKLLEKFKESCISLSELSKQYMDMIIKISETNKIFEHSLRMNISSISKKVDFLKELIKNIKSNILSGIIALRIINEGKIPFNVCTNKPIPTNSENNMPNSAILISEYFSINIIS